MALLGAAWRFARGTGRIPQVHGLMPEARFEECESPKGPLPAESEELLWRYYRVKVQSMQFFGPTNFNLPFWDGLDSLALTLPIVLWLSRLFHERPATGAIEQAVQIVDDNFGYNRLLGSGRQKFGLRLLSSRGELTRLIAWYAR